MKKQFVHICSACGAPCKYNTIVGAKYKMAGKVHKEPDLVYPVMNCGCKEWPAGIVWSVKPQLGMKVSLASNLNRAKVGEDYWFRLWNGDVFTVSKLFEMSDGRVYHFYVKSADGGLFQFKQEELFPLF